MTTGETMNDIKLALVSVRDRMPTKEGSYFCIMDDGTKEIVFFEDIEFNEHYDEFSCEYRYVNYWIDGIK